MRLIQHIIVSLFIFASCIRPGDFSELEKGFLSPPDSALPGVYWYFMDGNLSKDAMTKDLESMKKAGIGHLVYLEVNVGVPRGKVDFMTDEWKQLFKHAVEECERLGITITLGVGPGWTGSGGPWVKTPASMQHLVAGSTEVTGPGTRNMQLPVPEPRRPFFGIGGFTPGVRKQWEDYYEDVVVLAFPTPSSDERIDDVDEKALYYRAPYSSQSGVKQFLPTSVNWEEASPASIIHKEQIIDLSPKMKADGTLTWDVPEGKWTIMRFVSRNNGAVTRPAPLPGVGLESDKFDTIALNAHLDKFTGELIRFIGERERNLPGGLKMFHMDSWEMGAQNWTKRFREEFTLRRGYDPQPFYPAYTGLIVESREISERFLWDVRLTSQELILENHAGHIKQFANRYGMGLSIEPYDMNPTSDMELAVVADMPMCEFWSVSERNFNTSFSAMEGTSAAHLIGQPVVPAEAFTSQDDGWTQHPGSMKNQTDWAFAAGINRLVYHTFQHQALDDRLRPGMTMGPYGVHWDRNQTWWPMAEGYHRYVSRCQFLLQQGRTVADILYLIPEGAPHVFRAPVSAIAGELPELPDRKEYNFDVCPTTLLHTATVEDNCIVFPGGASYRILVLPVIETMTPALLEKIRDLIHEGATIVGVPPKKSPGLVNYPACDHSVKELATEIWGGFDAPEKQESRVLGDGKVIWSADMYTRTDNLYPPYDITADVLSSMGIPGDFESAQPVRYTHRTMDGYDMYFIANRAAESLTARCSFRITDKQPELWNPIDGTIRQLPEYTTGEKQTFVDIPMEPYQSYFIVFKDKSSAPSKQKNFPEKKVLAALDSSWEVSFDPAWGGPERVTFDQLTDWSKHTDDGIKYYSGTAVYSQQFDKPETDAKNILLDLGNVKNMARVWLNEKDMGIVWTAPWQVDITSAVKNKGNELKIEVVNLWVNRLIGDEHLPDDGIQQGQWPEWLLNGTSRPGKRYTFTTHRYYTKDSPLLESGLLGPVTLLESDISLK
jgi:Glycosyl hydrolases family 2, sugar binding domain.